MKIKIILKIAAMSMVLMLLISCGSAGGKGSEPSPDTGASDEPAAVSENEGVSLFPAALDIVSGKCLALDAEADGARLVEWTSSDTSIVSVGQDGTVSALSAGEAIVTVSAENSSDVCRVTVTEDGPTLAYEEDPGPVNEDGVHEQPEDQEDNYPLLIPDDQNSVDKTMFKDAEYAWQIIINDGFDTKLRVPMSGISYMTNCHITLDAHRVGDDALLGDYEGTMEMQMSIDEASFISAMQAAGIPATDFNSAVQVKTVDVNFKLVTYDRDKITAAKYAFAPSGTNPVLPLVQMPAMAISSAQTSTSGNMEMKVDEGYGYAGLSDKSGNIPIVIEVGPDGSAVLYLPKMLSMCDHDSFKGRLAKLRIVDIK